ncbi:MAG: ABC transporter permease subunit [Spirochaetales bacterium]|nr:ABC transporter permease subunit [Spirochaetales bacterium]
MKDRITLIKLVPLLAVVLFIGLAPLGNGIFTSFFHDIYGQRSFAGLENYRRIFTDQAFGMTMSITVLWAFLNTALALLVGFVAAVILAGKTRALPKILYGALLVPWGIPIYIAVPLWRAVIHGSGGASILTHLFGLRINLLLQPLAAFISALVVSLWMTVPLTAFVFLGSLKKVPGTVLEAATLDGAGRGIIARYIFLPHIRESIMVMAVLNFLKSFKEFSLVFLMTAGGPPLLSGITDTYVVGATTTTGMYLYDLFNGTDDFGIPAAYSVIVAAVVLGIMSLWLMMRSGKKHYRKMKILTLIVQLLFGGLPGLPWAAGYALSLKKDALFPLLVLLQVLRVPGGLFFQNFFEAFQPALIPALFALYLRKRSEMPIGKIRDLKGLPWKFSAGFVTGFFVLASLLVLYLLLWMSFSAVDAVHFDSLFPEYLSGFSYRRIFAEEGILRYFLNTLLVSGITGLIIPCIAFPAASFLSSAGKKFSGGFLTFIQILGISGGMHALIPLYYIFSRLHLIDSYLPLVLIYLDHAVPFSLFTMTEYLRTFPEGLKETAKLEGMGPFSYMWKILLPLSIPVVVTSVMVAFLGAWNGFMPPLLFLNDDTRYTISVKLYTFIGSIASGAPKWGLFSAASVINCLFIGLLFARFRRPLGSTALEDYE